MPTYDALIHAAADGKGNDLHWYLDHWGQEGITNLYETGVELAQTAMLEGDERAYRAARILFEVVGETGSDLASHGYEWIGLLYTGVRLDEPMHDEARSWFEKALDAPGKGDISTFEARQYDYADGGSGDMAVAEHFLEYYETGVPPASGHALPDGSFLLGSAIAPDVSLIEHKIEQGDLSYLEWAANMSSYLDQEAGVFARTAHEERAAGMKEETQQRLNTAVADASHDDYDLLVRACRVQLDLPLENQGDPEHAGQGAGSEACRHVEALAAETLAAEATCDDAATRYEIFYEDFNEQIDQPHNVMQAAGLQLAECGDWETLWTELAHWGAIGRDSLGVQLLLRLEAEGQPVLAEFQAHLDRYADTPFDYEHGRMTSSHAVGWLLESGHLGECDPFVSHAGNMSIRALSPWVQYFDESGCEQAAPLVTRVLDYNRNPHNPVTRGYACEVIGRLGNEDNLPTVRDVAANDPEYEVHASGRYYPVRERCEAALERLE